MNFKPNYKNIVDAALNKKPERIPMYEHGVSPVIMEQILDKKFAHLISGDYNDKLEFFKNNNYFFLHMGYDVVSFECSSCVIMPGSGALGGHKEGVIKSREDFDKYPWDKLCDYYFDAYIDYYKALRETMPEGMSAIGGVGNGVFEGVQDLVGYQELCYIKSDDEELYKNLFSKVGDVLCQIWDRFLKEFGDVFCVCRFGDDLGFKSDTLLAHNDVKELIIPQYKKIIEIIHSHNKPFLLHSCGAIFDVMDDIINIAKIDSKHSNEDAICEYKQWIDDYGDKIGNFGGLDTDALCDGNNIDIVEYTTNIYNIINAKNGGVAIGSGNSIPDYVSIERYRKANETIRKLRGDG